MESCGFFEGWLVSLRVLLCETAILISKSLLQEINEGHLQREDRQIQGLYWTITDTYPLCILFALTSTTGCDFPLLLFPHVQSLHGWWVVCVCHFQEKSHPGFTVWSSWRGAGSVTPSLLAILPNQGEWEQVNRRMWCSNGCVPWAIFLIGKQAQRLNPAHTGGLLNTLQTVSVVCRRSGGRVEKDVKLHAWVVLKVMLT